MTDWIEEALDQVSRVLNSKGNDYEADGEPFSNFTDTAEWMGVEPYVVALGMIVQKLSRLRALRQNGRGPENESVQDTILDIAGYAVLACAVSLFSRREEEVVAEAVTAFELKEYPEVSGGGVPYPGSAQFYLNNPEQQENAVPQTEWERKLEFLQGAGYKRVLPSGPFINESGTAICGSGPHTWGDRGEYWCTRTAGHHIGLDKTKHGYDNGTMTGVEW